MDAQGTRSAKSIRARLEDEDGKHVNRHFGFGHQVAGLPRQKRPSANRKCRARSTSPNGIAHIRGSICKRARSRKRKKQCLRSWKERLHSLPAVRAALVLQSPSVWPRMERPSSSRTQRTATRLPPSDRNLNNRPAESENRWRKTKENRNERIYTRKK